MPLACSAWAESAGALVLQPEGTEPPEKGVLPLAWNDLSHRIRNLPKASLNKRAPKRMSLAGAQHKMVVIYEPKSQELGEPLKGTPSTHILKPNSTAELPQLGDQRDLHDDAGGAAGAQCAQGLAPVPARACVHH